MATGDLTDVATVKALGEVSGTSKDTLIGTLITSASKWIADKTERCFHTALTHQDIVHGTGGTELFLRYGPAKDISGVTLTINGTSIPVQPADGQPGFFLADDNRVLCLVGYTFTRGKRNVRVQYVEDMGGIPADVATACVELVLSILQRGKRGEDTSGMNVENQNFMWSLREVPASADAVIERYSRRAPA